MNFTGLLRDLSHQSAFAAGLVLLSCLCFYSLKSDNKNKNLQKYTWIVHSLTCALVLFIFIGGIIRRLETDQVYDFTAFYLYAKVAASGHNFYLPENFQATFHSLHLPPLNYTGFNTEIVNVGFLYPPPTILLFTPLAFLSYKTALICWTIFNLFFAAGCVYLIYDLFLKQYKLNGLLLVTTLFFILFPVRATVSFSQTNFILLFLLLLMHKYADKKFTGIFLALALFTKPYMVVFGLFFVLKKQWQTILYFAVSAATLVVTTLLLFGKGVFFSYIYSNPSTRLPAWVFSESINESLHALLLRTGFITLDKPAVYTYVSLGIFALTALYLIYLSKRNLQDYFLIVLLLVGLLVYPGTLSYYGVMLAFIIFQFFDEKKNLGFKRNLAIPIVVLFFYLSSISIFACICFLLAVITIKSFMPASYGISDINNELSSKRLLPFTKVFQAKP